MKWNKAKTWKYTLANIFYGLLAYCLSIPAAAQLNLVPNPGFEIISDCELEFGQTYKAEPWKIINEPSASPDLYHACTTLPFFNVPILNCTDTLYPKSGDGMVGLVNLIAEEKIYARLLDKLPKNIDIYVAYSIAARSRCGNPYTILCYSNSQSLAFSKFNFQSQEVVLVLDDILYPSNQWTQIETCYQASGNEDLVMLGNFRSATETLRDCINIEPEVNFAYFFVDEIIVSPFDVVPDTLILCGNETKNVDATFYDIPIHWSDGLQGAIRQIDEGGWYTVMGELEDCFMTDQVFVIKIPDESESISIDLCSDGATNLTAAVPAIWNTGQTGKSISVNQPGTFTANLQSTCGERVSTFIVEEKACSIDYYVPNVFSPNGDGANDELEFFFVSEFEFSGTLNIFDRWGNLLFNAQNVTEQAPASWDGTFQGRALNPAVFVWTYEYASTKDNKARIVSGEFALLR